MRRFLFLSAILILIGGCDRPVVDLAPPRVEVVSPADLSIVRTDPTLDLALRAEVFGDIERIAVNGIPTVFNGSRNVYEISVSLFFGLNVLPVEVFDAEGLRGSDTLYVFQANLRSAPTPVSGSPRGRFGAAASSLPSGDVFVSGGTNTSGQALPAGTRIAASAGVFGFTEVTLNQARTGHSSTTLSDGRVLLIGGAQTEAPLVLTGTAEVFDPIGGTVNTVPIVTEQGTPVSVSRSGHTARLLAIDGIQVIYVYGGINAQNVPLSTIDVFRWDSGQLTLLSPPGGTSVSVPEGSASIPSYSQPAQAPIGSRGVSEGSAVVFGLPTSDDGLTAFSFDWLAPTGQRFPFDLIGRAIAPLSTPRASAAAVFTNGIVLVSGGTATDGTTLDSFETYVPSVNRTFRFPESVRLRIPRSDHTATLLPGGRIMVVGGRDASGAALFAIEAFQF